MVIRFKNNTFNITKINPKILIPNELRKEILKMSFKAGACHIGSSLSCVEILIAIFNNLKDDTFFFSKASGAATLYSLIGKDAEFLKQNPLYWPGGSLGHGLPISVGYALGNRNKKVYCLMADAELNEGTTWESLLFASHHKLNNLIVIIDYNKFQACGACADILNLEPLADKFKAFGCEIRQVDGHNLKAVESALTYPSLYKDKPIVIIANTIKGKGVDFMEGNFNWHYRNLTPELLEKALLQL